MRGEWPAGSRTTGFEAGPRAPGASPRPVRLEGETNSKADCEHRCREGNDSHKQTQERYAVNGNVIASFHGRGLPDRLASLKLAGRSASRSVSGHTASRRYRCSRERPPDFWGSRHGCGSADGRVRVVSGGLLA